MTLVKFEPGSELANLNKKIKKFFDDFDMPFTAIGAIRTGFSTATCLRQELM